MPDIFTRKIFIRSAYDYEENPLLGYPLPESDPYVWVAGTDSTHGYVWIMSGLSDHPEGPLTLRRLDSTTQLCRYNDQPIMRPADFAAADHFWLMESYDAGFVRFKSQGKPSLYISLPLNHDGIPIPKETPVNLSDTPSFRQSEMRGRDFQWYLEDLPA